ncbi:MAG: amidohydrolase family protein [Clostridia bacterium]|nr:amidohydrolase family protein [Clostridia bacterium]
MLRIKSDKIILKDKIFDGFVYVENGKITEVSKKEKPTDTAFDFTGKYLSAGFIDLHTHGGGGYAFTDSTVNDVIGGVNFHLSHGTTTILPTVSAGKFSAMEKATKNVSEAIESNKCLANVIGAHLEGPYLSQKQCGAQCPDFITVPDEKDYSRLIEKYGKYIARWTFAPEKDDGSFCKFLTENKIVASAGHTDATYEDMRIAEKNGSKLITHLYSCTSTVTRKNGFRRLGVIEYAFLTDDVFVEIIADGKHLPPELIKMIVKIIGKERVALICLKLQRRYGKMLPK